MSDEPTLTSAEETATSPTSPETEQGAATEDSPTTQPLPSVEERYRASSQEAQRLAALNQQLEQQNLQYRVMLEQQRYAQVQQVAPQQQQGNDVLSESESERFSNAIIAGDKAEIARIENIRANRLLDASRRATYSDLSQLASVAQSQQSFQGYLQAQGAAPGSPLYNEAVTRFGQMQTDPNYAFAHRSPESLGALALAEVKARRKTTAEVHEAGAKEFHTESAAAREPRSASWNPMSHLTPTERSYCDDRQAHGLKSATYKWYWDGLGVAEQKRRLSGKVPKTEAE